MKKQNKMKLTKKSRWYDYNNLDSELLLTESEYQLNLHLTMHILNEIAIDKREWNKWNRNNGD